MGARVGAKLSVRLGRHLQVARRTSRLTGISESPELANHTETRGSAMRVTRTLSHQDIRFRVELKDKERLYLIWLLCRDKQRHITEDLLEQLHVTNAEILSSKSHELEELI